MARILTISSQVARGHVGNSATTFPLMRRGHEVVAVPTVLLAHHPGHARGVARMAVPDIEAIGRDALLSPAPQPVDAALVGYLAGPDQAAAAARLVIEARRLKPGIPVLVDPIAGDKGSLYVGPAIIDAMAAELLPMADIATPNVTELVALVARARVGEAPDLAEEEIVAMARALGPPVVVVTSAPARGPDVVANFVVTADYVVNVETARIDTTINGAGDLLAGLILAGLAEGYDIVPAVATSAGIIHDVLLETVARQSDELALVAAQKRIAGAEATAAVTLL